MSWLSKFTKRAIRPVVQAVGDIALPAIAAAFGGPKAGLVTAAALDVGKALAPASQPPVRIVPTVQQLVQQMPTSSGFQQFSGGFGGGPGPAPWLPDTRVEPAGVAVNVQCGMPCGCPTPGQMQPGGFQNAAFPLLPALALGGAGAGAALSAIEAYLAARRLVRDVEGAAQDLRTGDPFGLRAARREREEAQTRERDRITRSQRLAEPPIDRPMLERPMQPTPERDRERQPSPGPEGAPVPSALARGARRLLAPRAQGAQRQARNDASRQTSESRAAWCARTYGEGTDSWGVCLYGHDMDGTPVPPGRGANNWPGLRPRRVGRAAAAAGDRQGAMGRGDEDMSMFRYGDGMAPSRRSAGPGSGGRASRLSRTPRRGSRLPRAERARRRRMAASPRPSRTRSATPAQLRARAQFAAMARARARRR